MPVKAASFRAADNDPMDTFATQSRSFEDRARAMLASVAAPDARRATQEFVVQADRDAAFQLDACVHCGRCAEACHFYLVTRDPRHTPVYKLRPMLKAWQRERAPFAALRRWLGLSPLAVTAAELSEWSSSRWVRMATRRSTTACRRCRQRLP